jgi:predicted transcriptional regulator
MLAVQKNVDLCDNYDDIAMMSVESHEELAGRNELYQLIQAGILDIENGRTLTEEQIVKNMDKALGM